MSDWPVQFLSDAETLRRSVECLYDPKEAFLHTKQIASRLSAHTNVSLVVLKIAAETRNRAPFLPSAIQHLATQGLLYEGWTILLTPKRTSWLLPLEERHYQVSHDAIARIWQRVEQRMPQTSTQTIRKELFDALESLLPGAKNSATRIGLDESDNDTQESFLVRAVRLDKHGHTDAALDLIYDAADDMMARGDFGRLDELLRDADVDQMSVDVLIGLLTATLAGKSRLPSRKNLFDRIVNRLESRGEMEEGLLVGLEG